MFLFVFALYHAVFIYLLFFFIINSLRETTRFLFFFFFFPNIFCNLIFIISPSLLLLLLSLSFIPALSFFLSRFLFCFYFMLCWPERGSFLFLQFFYLIIYLVFHSFSFTFLLFFFFFSHFVEIKWKSLSFSPFFPSFIYLFIFSKQNFSLKPPFSIDIC